VVRRGNVYFVCVRGVASSNAFFKPLTSRPQSFPLSYFSLFHSSHICLIRRGWKTPCEAIFRKRTKIVKRGKGKPIQQRKDKITIRINHSTSCQSKNKDQEISALGSSCLWQILVTASLGFAIRISSSYIFYSAAPPQPYPSTVSLSSTNPFNAVGLAGASDCEVNSGNAASRSILSLWPFRLTVVDPLSRNVLYSIPCKYVFHAYQTHHTSPAVSKPNQSSHHSVSSPMQVSIETRGDPTPRKFLKKLALPFVYAPPQLWKYK